MRRHVGHALALSCVLLSAPAGLRAEDGADVLPPELHQVAVGGVTAHFGGDRAALGDDLPDDLPARYFVTQLWFTFAGDPRTYVFRPLEELDFSDWQFDIFSPDGAYVLLVQGHYGPYHIVSTGRLKEYLLGARGPEAVASGDLPDGRSRIVEGARWTAPDAIEFTATCCGDPETIRFRVPRPGSSLPAGGSVVAQGQGDVVELAD